MARTTQSAGSEKPNSSAICRRILAAMDQPSIDGVNTWFVSKATRELGLKVAVSGVGGDELLGGYSTFGRLPKMVRAMRFLRHLPGRENWLRRGSPWRAMRVCRPIPKLRDCSRWADVCRRLSASAWRFPAFRLDAGDGRSGFRHGGSARAATRRSDHRGADARAEARLQQGRRPRVAVLSAQPVAARRRLGGACAWPGNSHAARR